MNNEALECETEDLKAVFLEFNPIDVHTETYITINKDGADFTKKLTLHDAKKLFGDEEQLDIFLNTYKSLYV
jgi:hypothetical protein